MTSDITDRKKSQKSVYPTAQEKMPKGGSSKCLQWHFLKDNSEIYDFSYNLVILIASFYEADSIQIILFLRELSSKMRLYNQRVCVHENRGAQHSIYTQIYILPLTILYTYLMQFQSFQFNSKLDLQHCWISKWKSICHSKLHKNGWQ